MITLDLALATELIYQMSRRENPKLLSTEQQSARLFH